MPLIVAGIKILLWDLLGTKKWIAEWIPGPVSFLYITDKKELLIV